MTTTSYNGWPASTDPKAIGIVPFTVAGIGFPGGVCGGDVHTVLGYVLGQVHARVEPLKSPGCWGYFYKPDANDPSKLSCHGSGTAVDANAPAHPNGIEASRNFTASQIAEIHKILAEIPELAEVVHWGGDWHRVNGLTPDPMHYEIHDHDTAKLARVADRIRAKEDPDMALLADLIAVAKKHDVSLVKAARVLLRRAAENAQNNNQTGRLAHIRAARRELKEIS